MNSLGRPYPKILIVGSGILGSSIAFKFSRVGVSVEVISSINKEKVTLGSFAWINASGPTDQNYFRLRVKSVKEWHKLKEVSNSNIVALCVYKSYTNKYARIHFSKSFCSYRAPSNNSRI